MSDEDWSQMNDIEDYRNAVSPICSKCGSPLEEDEEIERECCIVCWDYLTRDDKKKIPTTTVLFVEFHEDKDSGEKVFTVIDFDHEPTPEEVCSHPKLMQRGYGVRTIRRVEYV